jgi:plastocyanin
MAGGLRKTLSYVVFVGSVAILASLLSACTAASGLKSNGELMSPMAAVRSAVASEPAFSAKASGTAAMADQAAASANAAKVTVDLTARNIAFDKRVISVPAGVLVTINFSNTDLNTYHNFSVYTDEGAAIPIFKGKIISGPSTIQYVFMAPATAGNYFFRSDVHPAVMIGVFEVN